MAQYGMGRHATPLAAIADEVAYRREQFRKYPVQADFDLAALLHDIQAILDQAAAEAHATAATVDPAFAARMVAV